MAAERIAVIGGGSLGLYIAGRLALAGHPVTVALRPGSTRPEGGIRADGDERWQAGGVEFAPLDSLRGPYAQIVVAVKSQDLPDLLPRLTGWGDGATQYLFLQNGVPWWWPLRHGATAAPGGHPPLARSVAVVVHHAVERTAPGRIQVRRTGRDRYLCGRVGGAGDRDLVELARGWQDAGIPAEVAGDLGAEVWGKLMGNATLNPLSAITGATVGELATDPRTRAVLLAGMAEIAAIAAREGHAVSSTPLARVERAREVGGTRTSMLQDRLAGRPLETATLLAAPIELAERHGLAVPVLRTLLGCLALS